MLELYYRPFACSLASRIALEEAELPAIYHRVDLATKRTADGRDLLALSPKGQVPVLVTDRDAVLTEGAAVLQYIADRNPEAHLAPARESFERYELQAWLHFIATELHKAFLYPRFMDGTEESVRDYGRARFEEKLPHVAARLRVAPHLVGDVFSVADAYLFWVLVLAGLAEVRLPEELTAWRGRQEGRPAVARALDCERAELRSELAAKGVVR